MQSAPHIPANSGQPAPKLLGQSSVNYRDPNKGAEVRRMFAGISRRYDLLNRLMSFNRDQAWRRAAVKLSGAKEGSRVLDVCCGTGDMAFEFRRVVGDTGQVIGGDFTPEMLTIARAKGERRGRDASPKRPQSHDNTGRLGEPSLPVPFLAADTLDLPFRDGEFDVCSVAFGIRNVQDITAGIREMARVVKPGGRVVILECAQPSRTMFQRPYRFYMTRVVPYLGHLLSRSKHKAYSYLPDSVALFPKPDALADLMRAQGLTDVRFYFKTFGVVAIHIGTRGA